VIPAGLRATLEQVLLGLRATPPAWLVIPMVGLSQNKIAPAEAGVTFFT